MEPTPTSNHQPFFTPAGQLTSAGRDALAALGQAFRPMVLAARRAAAAMAPLAAVLQEAKRGPAIGRKRRRRRARGRARGQR